MSVSDESAPSGDEQEVEPDRDEAVTEKPTKEVEPKRAKSSSDTSLGSGGKSKASKTHAKWPPEPKLVTQMENSCVRKKLELRKPLAPMRMYLAAKRISAPSSSAPPGRGSSTAAGVPSTSIRDLVHFTDTWPKRERTPHVRDIISRHTSPQIKLGSWLPPGMGGTRKQWSPRNDMCRGSLPGMIWPNGGSSMS